MERRAWVILGLIFGGLFLSLFAFVLVAILAVRSGEDSSGGFSSGPAVGVLEIKGVIESADKTLKHLRRFSKDDHIKAIVVRVDSPGGAVAPSQEIYEELRKVGEKKKTVCSMGNVAASGGYYISAGCQKIIASAKLKDVGNPFREMTAEERAYFQSMMDSVHEQFIEAVAKGRDLKVEEVRPWADGRVLTGAQAKELKLVDDLGNFNDAVRLAAALGGIEGEPRLQYPSEDHPFRFEELLREGARALAHGVREEIAAASGASPIAGPAYLAPLPLGP
jgi:protease-4